MLKTFFNISLVVRIMHSKVEHKINLKKVEADNEKQSEFCVVCCTNYGYDQLEMSMVQATLLANIVSE